MQTTNRTVAGGVLVALGLLMAAGPVLADADPAAVPPQRGWGPADGPPGDRQEQGGWHEQGAWHERGGWHHHPGLAAEFHQLGLTEAQRASLKAIHEAARPAMQELMEKMRANARQLHDITPDDRNYAQVATRVSQEHGVLAGKLMAQRAKVYADSYALLAPVQKTRLAEIRAQRAKWMEEHKGRRGPSADADDAAEPQMPEA